MKSEKDKYMISLTYEIFLKDTYELTYKTEIDSHIDNKFMVSKGNRRGWRRDQLGVWN